NRDQRARLELIGHRSDVLQPLRPAESTQKTPALRPRPPQRRPLGENDGPGNYAESQKNQQHRLGHDARLPDQGNNLAPDREAEKRSIDHRKSNCLYELSLDRNILFHRRQTGHLRSPKFLTRGSYLQKTKAQGNESPLRRKSAI